MTHTATRIPTLRRFYRRAITVTALAIFAATAAATLAAPSPASAGAPAATVAAKAKAKPGPTQTAKDDDPGSAKKGKKPPQARAVTGVVNINTASETELQMLPGVGPTKAERVVAYRTERGKFRRVQDLRRVKGFGFKTLKKLEPHLTITGPTTIQTASASD